MEESVRLALVPEVRDGARASTPEAPTPQRVRLVDAALACIARQGIAGTTLDDVARAAGCSRATVYRAFPGGKEGLLSAVVDTEVARFFTSLAVPMAAAADLEDVLVAGMTEAARRIAGHQALSHQREHEPEVVLPHLAFAHFDTVLAVSATFTAPFLGRFLDHDEARRVAEWAARIVLSHLACPAEGVDLTDEAGVRSLVRTFMLPGERADSAAVHKGDRPMSLIPTTRGEAS
ncbi:MAG TPA: TetR/AcrR family transcriptional regulator [Acidimicrobiales bacterium]|nr:TetR/AcrR family transcriptional regulator [Acidimicrobiales bacterium]